MNPLLYLHLISAVNFLNLKHLAVTTFTHSQSFCYVISAFVPRISGLAKGNTTL